MNYCPVCGWDIRNEKEKCPHCGFEIPKETAISQPTGFAMPGTGMLVPDRAEGEANLKEFQKTASGIWQSDDGSFELAMTADHFILRHISGWQHTASYKAAINVDGASLLLGFPRDAKEGEPYDLWNMSYADGKITANVYDASADGPLSLTLRKKDTPAE